MIHGTVEYPVVLRGLCMALCLPACGGGCGESDGRGAPASAGSEQATGVPSGPPDVTPAPASQSAVELPAFGEVFSIENVGGDVLEEVIAIERRPTPRPDVAPIGHAHLHSTGWELRPIDADDVTLPAERATVVAGDRLCDARITGARRLHGTLRGADAPSREATFLALTFEGCDGASFGILGAEVTRHAVDPARLPTASRELVQLIRRRDAQLAGDDITDERITPPRALTLPEHDLAIVVGHGRWVVHRGRVVQNGYGRPTAVLVAGDQVLIELASISEGWFARLEDFEPWPERSAQTR